VSDYTSVFETGPLSYRHDQNSKLCKYPHPSTSKHLHNVSHSILLHCYDGKFFADSQSYCNKYFSYLETNIALEGSRSGVTCHMAHQMLISAETLSTQSTGKGRRLPRHRGGVVSELVPLHILLVCE